jgi:hypothetical protein
MDNLSNALQKLDSSGKVSYASIISLLEYIKRELQEDRVHNNEIYETILVVTFLFNILIFQF